MTDNFPHTVGRQIAVDAADHDEGATAELERLRREVADLRASRARLVRAGDAERRRIERDLHRGVQQDLVALAVNLELAGQLAEMDPGAAMALLAVMRDDVQRAIEETAQLAQLISPPLLDAGGFVVALRSAFANAGVPVSLDVAVADCRPDVAETVYLCCLGALAGATPRARASLSLHERGDAVVFEIRVDGSNVDGELGLLRDRVEALGGLLTIAQESGGIGLVGSLPGVR